MISGGKNELYNELWRACAGPLVYVPRVGDIVYYFLQGHMEQVFYSPVLFFLFFEFKIPVNVFNSANFVSYLHHNCYYQKHYGMVLFKSCGFH